MTKVCVTGGAGFLGSALVRELLNREYDVFVVDNFVSGSLENLHGILPHGDRLIHADVTGSGFVEAMSKIKPELVFHLAAEPFIPLGYAYPEKFMQTNYAGTLNVIIACKTFEVKKIIHYSSSECYGTTKNGEPQNEEFCTMPQSTYAVSKLAADHLCRVMAKERDIPVVIARPFNTYGPRETHPYIIPDVIAQFTKRGSANVGNLQSKRDFTYVEDHARAVALLAEKGVAGEIYNIGTGKSYSMAEVVGALNYIMLKGAGRVMIEQSRLRPWDVDDLICDSQKLRNLTGWKPEVSFEEGLQKTVDWYREAGQWEWEKRYWA